MVRNFEFSKRSYISFSARGSMLEFCASFDSFASQFTILGKQAFGRIWAVMRQQNIVLIQL